MNGLYLNIQQTTSSIVTQYKNELAKLTKINKNNIYNFRGMTNLFEFLKHYKDPNTQQSYGDILENNSMINSLSGFELSIYNQLKNSDRQRLIKSGTPQ